MKPIKEAIEEATATGIRLLAETPGLTSLSFTLRDYPIEEMRQLALAFDEMEPDYRASIQRFTMCHSPAGGLYIHIHSKEVNAKIVYE